MVTIGAVIGKLNNLQYLLLALAGSFLYTLNETVLISILKCRDMGSSMTVYTYGGFYGIGLALVLNYKLANSNKNLKSSQSSLTTAMFGTLLFWCFWPSFNGALAETKAEMYMAILNTYFSLIGSCLGAFLTSSIIFKGKIQMDIILNATIAGGVVMGSGADILHKGYIAYIVGILTGVISALMFCHSSKILNKIGILDVAGTFNLNAVPGVIGGLISAVFRQAYIDDRGYIQVAGTFISLSIGLFGGVFVGGLIRCFGYYKTENQFFNDAAICSLELRERKRLAVYCPKKMNLDSFQASVRLEIPDINQEHRQ
jgi:ammonia channel protein AmtB